MRLYTDTGRIISAIRGAFNLLIYLQVFTAMRSDFVASVLLFSFLFSRSFFLEIQFVQNGNKNRGAIDMAAWMHI